MAPRTLGRRSLSLSPCCGPPAHPPVLRSSERSELPLLRRTPPPQQLHGTPEQRSTLYGDLVVLVRMVTAERAILVKRRSYVLIENDSPRARREPEFDARGGPPAAGFAVRSQRPGSYVYVRA